MKCIVVELSGLFANPGPTSFMQVIGPIVKNLADSPTESRPDSPARVHRRRTHLSEQDMDDLVARYKVGATTKELAQEYQIHHKTVAIHLKRRAVAMRYKVMDSEDTALAKSLYESGMSLAKISEQTNWAPNTIRRALLESGVRMRDAHGRPRTQE